VVSFAVTSCWHVPCRRMWPLAMVVCSRHVCYTKDRRATQPSKAGNQTNQISSRWGHPHAHPCTDKQQNHTTHARQQHNKNKAQHTAHRPPRRAPTYTHAPRHAQPSPPPSTARDARQTRGRPTLRATPGHRAPPITPTTQRVTRHHPKSPRTPRTPTCRAATTGHRLKGSASHHTPTHTANARIPHQTRARACATRAPRGHRQRRGPRADRPGRTRPMQCWPQSRLKLPEHTRTSMRQWALAAGSDSQPVGVGDVRRRHGQARQQGLACDACTHGRVCPQNPGVPAAQGHRQLPDGTLDKGALAAAAGVLC
jgi:hypothetical protein